MKHNTIITNEGRAVIILFKVDGEPAPVTDSHPNFTAIKKALDAGEDPTPMLDATNVVTAPAAPIEKIVQNLSAHISLVDGVLHYDGDPAFDYMSETLRRYNDEGRDATNLVRFMERVALNPSESSREQLFTWSMAKDLTVTPDGMIVGYKGVTKDGLSVHSGAAIVDGVEVKGQIPNKVGSVIEMPRHLVNEDPHQGCSHGLHVGNWSYASSFGAITLEVEMDPADVVSVPADASYQKLRCCRYKVLAIHDKSLGDDLDHHEPEVASDEAWADFVKDAPEGWVRNLFKRMRRNKNQTVER